MIFFFRRGRRRRRRPRSRPRARCRCRHHRRRFFHGMFPATTVAVESKRREGY